MTMVRKTIDPRIPTTPGRSLGFSRTQTNVYFTKHEAPWGWCSAGRMNGELHPTRRHRVRRTSAPRAFLHMNDSVQWLNEGGANTVACWWNVMYFWWISERRNPMTSTAQAIPSSQRLVSISRILTYHVIPVYDTGMIYQYKEKRGNCWYIISYQGDIMWYDMIYHE